MKSILEPAACRDPPALVAQGVHPSSCYCPVLELEEKTPSSLNLQFNPRERSRFEDKSVSPMLLLLGLEEARLRCLGRDATLVLMYLNR